MKNMEQNLGVGHCRATECGNELTKRQVVSGGVFCSHRCYSYSKIGKKHSWGAKISAKLKGKAKSKEHVENVRKALTGRKRPEITGVKNWNWKGQKVGYDALHDWVRRHNGKPKKCEHCGAKNRKLHWSNKSHKYLRNLSDWISLCVPCHSEYDKAYRLSTPDLLTPLTM